MYNEVIDKHFLSTFLSEEVEEMSNDLADLMLKENVGISDISDFLVKLEGTDINDNIKLTYLTKLCKVFENNIETAIDEEVEVFNEYAGNPKKNKILIRLMGEMEKNLEIYYDECVAGVKALDSMLSIVVSASKAKNPNVFEAAKKCKTVESKVRSDFDSDQAKRYNTTWNAIKKICKAFSVKFSDVVMEDKKAFDKKLDAAVQKARNNQDFKRWLPNQKDGKTAAITEYNDAIDILYLANKDQAVAITKEYFSPVYRYVYYSIMGYMGNINYLRSILGLEKEGTFFYNAINKIFKSPQKKEDK